jgi:glucosamine--fructose-6-phosphate aminotransferase (isomerizing)
VQQLIPFHNLIVGNGQNKPLEFQLTDGDRIVCGIVAAVASKNVVPTLIVGLKALEYRGYDSAGIALLNAGHIESLRTEGKVRELESLYQTKPIEGFTGIAHTRWATHGVPSERNAHPMISRQTIAVVHNGIIENHNELRAELKAQGYEFSSDTDTEVIAHLVDRYHSTGESLLSSVQKTVSQLRGAYAIAVISRHEPGVAIGARRGSPMVLGLAEHENYLASDVQALLSVTRRYIYLQEGDIAEIRRDQISVFDAQNQLVNRPVQQTQMSLDAVQRGEYKHYMLKEIHEQPSAIADTLEGRLHDAQVLTQVFGVDAEPWLRKTKAVHLVACGSSYHAALVAKYWIEQLARIPVNVEIASEYRYREPVVPVDCLLVTVSQSGETADTLAALRMAKQLGYHAELAICNVPESSLVRESKLVLMTRAGPEIGVASTKAFITQLTALALLAIELGRYHQLDAKHYQTHVRELESLPGFVALALKLDPAIRQIATAFADKTNALFLGRGVQFPIAMEGALKLKEISYIHAEAYPAGELKHGPLALVDEHMPVIAVAPSDRLLEKLKSNIEEVRARGGKLLVLADDLVGQSIVREKDMLISMPKIPEFIAPMVYTIPLQLLAYHVAVLKGTDVDQPRNLAKSVTVE